MSLRCNVRLAAGVTLPVLLVALQPFFEGTQTELVEGEDVPEFGEVAMVDHDDTIELQADGSLFLCLGFYGPGHGIAPDCVELACDALDTLVATGGTIEYIDHDTSASSDDAIGVRFLGANEAAKTAARIDYALEQARPWLDGAISPEAITRIETLARASASA